MKIEEYWEWCKMWFLV